MVAAAIGVGVAAAGAIGSSVVQSKAAGRAGRAQSAAAAAGIDTQDEALDKIMGLLQPYSDAGTSSLDSLRGLLGLNGADAQQGALDALKASPTFTNTIQQGENAILQNASATGGLRGGNVQDALSRFRGDTFSKLIQTQIGNLQPLVSIGANAAGAQVNATQTNANNVTNLLAQQGQAQAGQALAQGNAIASGIGGVTKAVGMGIGGLKF